MLMKTLGMWDGQEVIRTHRKSGWTAGLAGGHPPVVFRLHEPVLEVVGFCSTALGGRFLLFSLLAKASK